MAILPYASRGKSNFRRVNANPASGANGETILNRATNEVKVWYDGVWQTLHTLTVYVDYLLLQDGGKMFQEDGSGILLEG
jgi:hypothetical protein